MGSIAATMSISKYFWVSCYDDCALQRSSFVSVLQHFLWKMSSSALLCCMTRPRRAALVVFALHSILKENCFARSKRWKKKREKILLPSTPHSLSTPASSMHQTPDTQGTTHTGFSASSIQQGKEDEKASQIPFVVASTNNTPTDIAGQIRNDDAVCIQNSYPRTYRVGRKDPHFASGTRTRKTCVPLCTHIFSSAGQRNKELEIS